jgi:hypothetical protein
MSFETPSDRFGRGLRKFFLLEPLSSRRIVRVIWVMAFVIYSLHILGSLLTVANPLNWQGSWLSWATAFLVFQPLIPLLWLLIIRLVLEVCDRALQTLQGSDKRAEAAE